MGNCSLKGVTDTAKTFNFIRLMTDSGEILKLKGPKLVGEVLHSFPGYKIFGQGHFSTPLFDHEELVGGKFYYLLPLLPDRHQPKKQQEHQNPVAEKDEGNGREPVRVSSAAMEVLNPPQKGVWRVKLAISPKQLEEILAEEVNTEALIEQMRMAAAVSLTTTTTTTPRRRTKSSWGGLIWKPILANVLLLKSANENQENGGEEVIQTVDLYTNTQANLVSS